MELEGHDRCNQYFSILSDSMKYTKKEGIIRGLARKYMYGGSLIVSLHPCLKLGGLTDARFQSKIYFLFTTENLNKSWDLDHPLFSALRGSERQVHMAWERLEQPHRISHNLWRRGRKVGCFLYFWETALSHTHRERVRDSSRVFRGGSMRKCRGNLH